MNTPSGAGRFLWRLAAVGLPAYAFLYDNATSLPAAQGYGWTRLTPLTRQVRLLEIGVIAILLGLALAQGVTRTSRNLLIGTLLFLGIGLTSYLHSSEVPLIDGVRLIYMWLLPAFIFIIGREAPWERSAWTRTAMTVLVWVVVSALVSWFQFAWLGYPVGDDITGLNKDAHANGTLMMMTAWVLLAFGLFYERRGFILAALVLLVTMVLSSVLKVMFLGVVSLALLLWLFLRTGPRRRTGFARRGLRLGLAAAITVAIVGFAFTQVDVISSNRLGDLGDKVQNNPESLGPLQAHTAAASKLGKDLQTLVLGLGPFRFANPISVGQVVDAGRLARSASGEVLAVEDEKGEQTRITLSSSLLGEFGVPAFVIVIVMYLSIGRAIWPTAFHDRLDIRARSAGLLAAGALLALVPLTSLFGSLDVMSVSWPVLLLSGMLCREAAEPMKVPR
jgi:hypothetical protein